MVYTYSESSVPRDRLANYVRFYQTLSPTDVTEQFLVTPLQERFVFLLPNLDPRNLISGYLSKGRPAPQYLFTFGDRSVKADYQKADLADYLEERRRRAEGAVPDAVEREALSAVVESIEEAVARVRSRGGRVAFVRFPSSGADLRAERTSFPRERYWDFWASRSGAVMIHYQDHASLSGFECPDYSHLDYRDAAAFSKALALILKEKFGEQGE